MNKSDLQFLKKNHACKSEMAWLKKGKYQSLQKAWTDCENSLWMLWLLEKKKLLDKKTAMRLAIIFAKDVLPIFEAKYPDDRRPRRAIEAVESYLKTNCHDAADLNAFAATTVFAATTAIAFITFYINNDGDINAAKAFRAAITFVTSIDNDSDIDAARAFCAAAYTANAAAIYTVNIIDFTTVYYKYLKRQANQIRELIPELPESNRFNNNKAITNTVIDIPIIAFGYPD